MKAGHSIDLITYFSPWKVFLKPSSLYCFPSHAPKIGSKILDSCNCLIAFLASWLLGFLLAYRPFFHGEKFLIRRSKWCKHQFDRRLTGYLPANCFHGETAFGPLALSSRHIHFPRTTIHALLSRPRCLTIYAAVQFHFLPISKNHLS